MRELLDNHLVTHATVIIDESSSMRRHQGTVVKVIDGLVAELAEQSRVLDQETRLSVYAFNSRGTDRCLVWDLDVLRVPSIDGLYQPQGLTALIDCTVLALGDLAQIFTRYGDHAFFTCVITDGDENDSRGTAALLRSKIDHLGDNHALGIFVPDERGRTYALRVGFPQDGIKVWDPRGHNAVESVGTVMRDTSRNFMQARKSGVRSFRGGLFGLKEFSASDVQRDLIPVTPGGYELYPVSFDAPIKDFVLDATGQPLALGCGYYQLTRKVKVQSYKRVYVLVKGVLYGGPQARAKLGLPDYDVEFDAGDARWREYQIFIESTSANRKLLAGTTFLLMRS